jgi:pyruvate,orthophosphate dikinase
LAKQFIYPFTFGDKSKSDLLGGKGANLAEMVQMGLPVPPGFTITTDACREYLTTGSVPAQLGDQINTALSNLEKVVEKKFGDATNPLLVSVRSGAKHSMPGMMETVLNVGITPEVADAMAKSSGNEKFAWDSYRRFIDMFGRIVCEIPDENVHKIEAIHLQKMNVKVVADLPAASLKELAQDLIKAIEQHTKNHFQQNQLIT